MKPLVWLLLCLCLLPGLAADAPPAPGASLAAMTLFDLTGKRHALRDVKTGRVVIVCWAFWCDTWKAALPQVKALAAESPALNCTVWTMSIDGTYTAEIRPLADRLPFPVLLDTGAWRDRLVLRRVPTILLLDRARKVVTIYEGYPGNAVLESAIRRIK
jgi:thiol-disulfide isomerase/thioredoxin